MARIATAPDPAGNSESSGESENASEPFTAE